MECTPRGVVVTIIFLWDEMHVEKHLTRRKYKGRQQDKGKTDRWAQIFISFGHDFIFISLTTAGLITYNLHMVQKRVFPEC